MSMFTKLVKLLRMNNWAKFLNNANFEILVLSIALLFLKGKIMKIVKKVEVLHINCSECGTELTDKEIDRGDKSGEFLCEGCDDECYCSRCVG